MSSPIISVENLGKCYRIAHQGEKQRYTALRDVIAQKCAAPFQALFGKNGSGSARASRAPFGASPKASSNSQLSTFNSQLSSSEDFWALRNVSFEIGQGEVVGIIGRNGAGKSTLLKILSRITEPTQGRVTLRGRVASLLEVGTGFHPELTGRENIFLNGAILGMQRAEIRKKFDEIVAFAEVEKFLDTPVKRYSSGMYVRLAFAVAAHLEPEILIVDEVLAVGDAEFQKKCLGKMQDVSRGGRTVLFVSHNMAAVRHLCGKGIYLVNGSVCGQGPIGEVVDRYLSSGQPGPRSQTRGKHGLELKDFRLCSRDSVLPRTSAIFGQDYDLHFQVHVPVSLHRVSPVIRIYNSAGVLVSSICSTEEGIEESPSGTSNWKVRVPSIQLMPGKYSVDFQMYGYEQEPYLEMQNVLAFGVEASLLPETSCAYRSDHGIVRIASEMSVNTESQIN
jgi:lipopolysaccharide transport system ATP-binding protein